MVLVNFRQVGDVAVYRSGSLDYATPADRAYLADMNVRRIIDLRNADEGATSGVPILGDVEGFWSAVEAEAPAYPLARLATLWDGQAHDRALARYLEDEGLPGLYRAMLTSGISAFGDVMGDILDSLEGGDGVLVHCQKGKDRTGLVSAFVEICRGHDRPYCLASYSASEDEDYVIKKRRRGLIDWSRFRGAPPEALDVTLDWIDLTYGGVSSYLDLAGFSQRQQERLANLNPHNGP